MSRVEPVSLHFFSLLEQESVCVHKRGGGAVGEEEMDSLS